MGSMIYTMLIPVLVMAGIGIVFTVVIALGRRHRQQLHDRYRTVFQVHYPSEMPYKTFEGFMSSLAGLPTVNKMGTADTIVFERYGKGKDIRYYLSVPDHLVSSVKGLFGGHIKDGLLVEPEEDLARDTEWDTFTELSLSSGYAPLDIRNPELAITNLLAGFAQLEDDQAVLTQWAIVPTHTPHPPDQVDQAKAKEKLSHRLFLATGRFATKGPKSVSLMHRLYDGLQSMKMSGVYFKRRPLLPSVIRQRVRRRAGAVFFPCVVNAAEIAVLTSPTVAGVHIAGLPKTKAMPPSSMIPSKGIVIGESDYPGLKRPLALSQRALSMNTWIIGPTGSGKSTTLENMAQQAMEQNMGLIVIEPKGDLARRIANFVPAHRMKDVIWFDPNDKEFPIGMNILDGTDPERTAGNVVAIFKKKYPDSWGPRLAQVLSHAVYTASLAKLDFYGVKQLLVNAEFRAKVLRRIDDNDLKQFWRGFDSKSDIYADSAINKLDSLLRPKSIRNILSQRTGLNMADVIRTRKIVLIPLEGSLIGEENAAVLGSLFVSHLWQHILQRRENESYPVMLILDEFQEYLSFGIEGVLARARSYQFPVVMANQNMSQLKDVLSAVENNARTKIAYATVHKDAEELKNFFQPMTKSELENIPEFGIAIKAMTDTGLAPVATARATPPPLATGSAEEVIRHSRATWGRPAADVEAETEARYQLDVKEKRRPRIGEVADD